MILVHFLRRHRITALIASTITVALMTLAITMPRTDDTALSPFGDIMGSWLQGSVTRIGAYGGRTVYVVGFDADHRTETLPVGHVVVQTPNDDWVSHNVPLSAAISVAGSTPNTAEIYGYRYADRHATAERSGRFPGTYFVSDHARTNPVLQEFARRNAITFASLSEVTMDPGARYVFIIGTEGVLLRAGQSAQCGNGVREAGEQCDAGALNGRSCLPTYGSSCQQCDAQCTIVVERGPWCGDGLLTPDRETCDDGNTVDGDGCSRCTIDSGYRCTGEPSVCTPGPPLDFCPFATVRTERLWDDGSTSTRPSLLRQLHIDDVNQPVLWVGDRAGTTVLLRAADAIRILPNGTQEILNAQPLWSSIESVLEAERQGNPELDPFVDPPTLLGVDSTNGRAYYAVGARLEGWDTSSNTFRTHEFQWTFSLHLDAWTIEGLTRTPEASPLFVYERGQADPALGVIVTLAQAGRPWRYERSSPSEAPPTTVAHPVTVVLLGMEGASRERVAVRTSVEIPDANVHPTNRIVLDTAQHFAYPSLDGSFAPGWPANTAQVLYDAQSLRVRFHGATARFARGLFEWGSYLYGQNDQGRILQLNSPDFDGWLNVSREGSIATTASMTDPLLSARDNAIYIPAGTSLVRVKRDTVDAEPPITPALLPTGERFLAVQGIAAQPRTPRNDAIVYSTTSTGPALIRRRVIFECP